MPAVQPVIIALRRRFHLEWNGRTPVTYDLQPESKQPDKTYCHFRVTRGTMKHAAGNNQTGEAEQIGRVWLQVFVPRDQGDSEAQGLLDQFGNIFGNWWHQNPDIQCDLPDVGPDGVIGNGRFMMSISVPYRSTLRY